MCRSHVRKNVSDQDFSIKNNRKICSRFLKSDSLCVFQVPPSQSTDPQLNLDRIVDEQFQRNEQLQRLQREEKEIIQEEKIIDEKKKQIEMAKKKIEEEENFIRKKEHAIEQTRKRHEEEKKTENWNNNNNNN